MKTKWPTSIQEKFDREISQLRELRNCAAALADYIHALTPGSTLQRYTEWTLDPDNWVSVRFAPSSPRRNITMTLGVPLSSLPDTGDLDADRRRTWARIKMRRVDQLPTVLRCLQHAHRHAKNTHRKKHGPPK